MKSARVFVCNKPNEWHVVDGRWGKGSLAVCKDKQTAELLGDVMPNLIRQFIVALTECHQDEIDREHYGDKTDSCSYCKLIKQAQAALNGEIV